MYFANAISEPWKVSLQINLFFLQHTGCIPVTRMHAESNICMGASNVPHLVPLLMAGGSGPCAGPAWKVHGHAGKAGFPGDYVSAFIIDATSGHRDGHIEPMRHPCTLLKSVQWLEPVLLLSLVKPVALRCCTANVYCRKYCRVPPEFLSTAAYSSC